MIPKIHLDGADLDQSAAVTWAETAGVQPYMMVVELDKQAAGRISIGKEVSLSIKANDQHLDVRKVIVVGDTAAQDPFRRALIVSDLRVLWRRKRVFRRYNIRTRTGERRRLDPDGTSRDEIDPVVDDIFYKGYSLKDGEAWTAADVLEDILNEVAGRNKWTGDLSQFDQKHVDQMEIDDMGPTAVARVLRYLPGAEIKVRIDGMVVVYNRLNTAATGGELASGFDPIIGPTLPAFVDLTPMRPKRIDVFFDVEQELRFTVDNPANAGAAFDEFDLFAEMVIRVPDPTLDLGDRKVPAGTWVKIDDVLTAWNNSKGGVDVPDLTHDRILENWMMNRLEGFWAQLGKITPSVLWISRIAALRSCWRQCYRINRKIIDRIHSMSPYRVGLLDFETGQRAQNTVYAHHAYQFNDRGFLSQDSEQYKDLNIFGGVDIGDPVSAGDGPSLAELQIVDEQVGVVKVNYLQDLMQHMRMIVPANFKNLSTVSAEEWGTSPYFQDGTKTVEAGVGAFLKAEHKLNFFVTAVPGAPNTERQLYPIVVSPDDAVSHLPSGVSGQITGGQGPIWEVRIGGQMTTARFAWDHGKRAAISESMAFDDEGAGNDRSDIEDLLQNQAELVDLAQSTAAALYATMIDRWVGSQVSPFDAQKAVAGNISRVEWSVEPDGRALTRVIMPEELPITDATAMLSDSARRVIQRKVEK